MVFLELRRDSRVTMGNSPTPVFLLGESHGQGSLVGYSPWGHKESDITEQCSLFTHWSPNASVLMLG